MYMFNCLNMASNNGAPDWSRMCRTPAIWPTSVCWDMWARSHNDKTCARSQYGYEEEETCVHKPHACINGKLLGSSWESPGKLNGKLLGSSWESPWEASGKTPGDRNRLITQRASAQPDQDQGERSRHNTIRLADLLCGNGLRQDAAWISWAPILGYELFLHGCYY